MLYKYLAIVASLTLVFAVNLQSINEQLNSSLLWGPYRPNLYFGVRPRIPKSLLSGLMWYNVDDYQGIMKVRHSCNQEDDMKGFGWIKYDPRSGGREVIRDNDCKIDIVIDFVKNEEGNWGAQIRGIPKKGYANVKTSLVFYTGLEGEGLLTSPSMDDTVEGDVELIGFSEQLGGGFTVAVSEGSVENKKPHYRNVVLPNLDPAKTHYLSLHVPDDNIWRADEIFMTMLQESIESLTLENPDLQDIPADQLYTIRSLHDFSGNMHFVQKTFQGEFTFFVSFNKDFSEELITAETMPLQLKNALKNFDEKFAKKFQLQSPFNDPKYEKFGKDFLSNLLGGIGYFYGDSLVDRDSKLDEVTFGSIKLEGEAEEAQELFTSVPSRPFFPRGFYWDEGFHLLPILEFDSSLALEILKSWFDLIDENGWIAREQILGPEARSKVPEEFQVQNPNIANPPTMMLVFTKLLQDLKQSNLFDLENQRGDVEYDSFETLDLSDAYLQHPDLLIEYAKEVYPKLQSHYEWFRRTQKGDLKEFDRNPTYPDEAYRWKGRSITHCLPSGLDDYPRAATPDTAELNVDMISWIGVMTRSMKTVAQLLDRKDDAERYSQIEKAIKQNIEDLHWSDKDECYCDVTVDDEDEDVFVCHKGYVSLFPFIHKFIPADSEKLLHVLTMLTDPNELWSDYGIRSLSKSDEFFHTAEDYWRGNIWVNMNYLVLDALQFYANDPETSLLLKDIIASAYKSLRNNLVTNIYKEWKSTGYAYEQYQESDGKGTRTRHFLGWTSLALLIMNMPESL